MKNGFDYHLKQHDSQTTVWLCSSPSEFDYHLKQHDSQTSFAGLCHKNQFDYHLKQHDSQTSNLRNATTRAVLFQMAEYLCNEFTTVFTLNQLLFHRGSGRPSIYLRRTGPAFVSVPTGSDAISGNWPSDTVPSVPPGKNTDEH